MPLKRTILAALFAAFIAVVPALAADPSIGRAAVTLPDAKEAQTAFKSDAPQIVLHAELLDMQQGTKVSADWIAENTNGAAPPNYKIDSAEMTIKDEDEATFSLSKPTNGWPVGDYRVDLLIDGTKAKSVTFKIAD